MSKKYLTSSKFEVRKGIQGVGVFATVDIKRGTILFKLDGKIVPAPTRTSVQVGKNRHVENVIAGYVNHSCSPNAKVYSKLQAFMSLKDIKKGDEITFNYNENEDMLASPFICECCGKEIGGKIKSKEGSSESNE